MDQKRRARVARTMTTSAGQIMPLSSPDAGTDVARPSETERPRPWYQTTQGLIAIFTALSISLSIFLSLRQDSPWHIHLPLYAAYIFGGVPLLWTLIRKAFFGDFGSDLLAGISIVTAAILDQYLAGAFVILMLSGGEAIENYAMKRASAVLDALSQRMPRNARRRNGGASEVVSLSEVQIGDLLEIPPHDIAPVDGIVREGNGLMDES